MCGSRPEHKFAKMQHISLSPLTLSSTQPGWHSETWDCSANEANTQVLGRVKSQSAFSLQNFASYCPYSNYALHFSVCVLNIFQLLLYVQANAAFLSPGLGIWPPAHSPLLTMSFDIISLSLGCSCTLLHNVHNFTLTLLLHLSTDFTWRSVLWHSDLPLPFPSPRKGARWAGTCDKKGFWTLLQCLTSSPS